MKLTDFLSDVGRPVAYYPSLRRITGSTNATIFLCQLIYWKGKEADPAGWIYKESDEIETETGLSYGEQKTARKLLVEAGLIEEHYARLDHQMKFKVLLEAINEKWGIEETDIPESGKPQFGNDAKPLSLNESENTAENTAENTTTEDFSTKNTAYRRGEQGAPDKVAAMLEMANFPGAKLQARIDSILSYLGAALQRNTETKEWKEFAKYVDSERQTKGWDVQIFVQWMKSQKGYDPAYWSCRRMREFYPMAFVQNEPQEDWRDRSHAL